MNFWVTLQGVENSNGSRPRGSAPLPVYMILLVAASLHAWAFAEPTKTWDGYADITENEQMMIAIANMYRNDPMTYPHMLLALSLSGYYGSSIDNLEELEEALPNYEKYASRPPLVYLQEVESEADRLLDETEPYANLPSQYEELKSSGEFLDYPFLVGGIPFYSHTFAEEYDMAFYVNASTYMGGGDQPRKYFLDWDEAPGSYRSPDTVTAYFGVSSGRVLHWPDGRPYEIANVIYVTADTYPSRPYDDTFWITGTVFRDANGNGRYDAGEQVPGVEIVPSRGEYKAISAEAGGYAIPFPRSAVGPLTIVATAPDGWTKEYNVELEAFSERSGDGGLLLNVDMPTIHKPALFDHVKAYGWASETEEFEIEFEIEGLDQLKRLFITAEVGLRPVDWLGPYDDDGFLRSNADPYLRLLDEKGNELDYNEAWNADYTTGLARPGTDRFAYHAGYGDTDEYDWNYRSASLILFLKPGKYTLQVGSQEGSGPVLVGLHEVDEEIVKPPYTDVPSGVRLQIRAKPEHRPVRVSNVRIYDRSEAEFPRHMEATGTSPQTIGFEATLGLGTASLKVEGAAASEVKLATVKGGALAMPAEIRVGDLDELDYNVSQEAIRETIVEFNEHIGAASAGN